MINKQLETEAVEIGLQFINGNKENAYDMIRIATDLNDQKNTYPYRIALAVEVYVQLKERTYTEEAEDFRRYLSVNL